MAARLDRVTDWEALARQARFRLQVMARLQNVSRRTLYTRLAQFAGREPRLWIEALRLRRGEDMLKQRISLKEIAHELALRPTSLSRLFHRALGCGLAEYLHRQSQISSGSVSMSAPVEAVEPELSRTIVVWYENSVQKRSRSLPPCPWTPAVSQKEN